MLRRTLGLGLASVLRPTQPAFHVPKRNWTQVGHIVCVPARVWVSFWEKLLHGAFMITVWLTPMAYGMTQIKVWRREYIDT